MEGRRPPLGSWPNSAVAGVVEVAQVAGAAAVRLAGFGPWAAGSRVSSQRWVSPRNGQE